MSSGGFHQNLICRRFIILNGHCNLHEIPFIRWL